MKLDHIFIRQEVISLNLLAILFLFAPYTSKFQLLPEILVDLLCKIENSGSPLQDHRILEVRGFPRGLGIGPEDIEKFKTPPGYQFRVLF